ncbi:aldehyde dehydrogenase family protein [Clostridium sp. WLY-B-L2]|uniref:Aldehyde dehydrogenase family protein n=1 Tax=Clostridium aromativorans TaxID=2836848 RepID=A0ABS8N1D6_9CLOT|nr:aldehyde dehydrogenase family protein [Clostridium aromativorans]MCC9293593.1 aldehyde dehydrogenase family protein [Clostridium aromativorans]
MSINYAKWNKLYIDGKWKEGSSAKINTITNPYNGEEITKLKLGGKKDIDEAYEAAKSAQLAWSEVSAYEKIALMEKAAQLFEERKEELIKLLIDESGSARIKAEIEVDCCITDIKEAAKYPMMMKDEIFPSCIPGKENRAYYFPVGVVGIISPWNWPLYLSVRGVAPALAAGNGVVLKAASLTPISGGLVIAKILEDAGFPKGIFNVVVADPGEIGDYFSEHPIPRVISFTGSTNVGRRIGEIAGKNLKRASLELGGNNVFIVLDDADIDQAVKAAAFGRYFHQGQICISTNRMIVDRKVYSEFVNKFKKLTKKIKVGDPNDVDTIIGPMITKKQINRALEVLDNCEKEGAKIEVHSEVNGNMMSPSIVTNVKNDMTIAKTELFSPIAVIIPVDSEEEAISVANDSDVGLSGAVFSGLLERGIRVAKQIETGMIHVNDQTVGVDSGAPFGGEKGSGFGRYCGAKWTIGDFTTVKWISVQKVPRQFPF